MPRIDGSADTRRLTDVDDVGIPAVERHRVELQQERVTTSDGRGVGAADGAIAAVVSPLHAAGMGRQSLGVDAANEIDVPAASSVMSLAVAPATVVSSEIRSVRRDAYQRNPAPALPATNAAPPGSNVSAPPLTATNGAAFTRNWRAGNSGESVPPMMYALPDGSTFARDGDSFPLPPRCIAVAEMGSSSRTSCANIVPATVSARR